ncbi:MAG: RDD family protein [Gammaproteobacteria bacterium]|nr:RDD family protein [Gammaproteobacteria bacterium]
MNDQNIPSYLPPAVSLFRRLMAIFYDFFLLTAILFIATAIFNALLNHGEALDSNNPNRIILSFYLGAIIVFYFGWFWTHGGQTLGMKTWKMRLVSNHSQITAFNAISWKHVLIREATAMVSCLCLGLGFLWSLFDRKKRCWHDMTSDTALIDLR